MHFFHLSTVLVMFSARELFSFFTLSMQRPPLASASKALLAPVCKTYCFRITFLSYAIHISFGANSSTNLNDLFDGGPLRSSSSLAWCYGILDSWCASVSLSSFQILIDIFVAGGMSVFISFTAQFLPT